MILGGFDSLLKTVQANSAVMSQGNSFNIVSNLSAAVSYLQNLAHMVQTGGIGGNLGSSLLAKLAEIDAIFTSLGAQHLAMYGIYAQGQSPSPFMATTPINNQNFYYPTMGGNQVQPQPQAMMQQAPMPQPAMPQAQPMPQSMPTPEQAAQPAVAPAVAQAPTAPAPTAAASGSSGPSVFTALPGMSGGGGPGAGDGKEAKGRDFLLSLLQK